MSVVPNSDQRVKTPLYRAPGSNKWEEISWDEAIERVAKKMKQIRDENWIDKDVDGDEKYPANRTEALGFIGGAQNNNEETYTFVKMARALGATYIEHQARL